MQVAERRSEFKRLDIARPLEIVGSGGDDVLAGYTRNLSDAGVRARFDGRCTVGANLLVRITLEEGVPPVEKRARVVWTAPDVYGEGTDVGLRLLADEAEEEAAAAEEAPRRAVPRLAVGDEVEVECGGIALPATIAQIGDITDGGAIVVTLALYEGALAGAADDEPIVVEKAPIVVTAERYAAHARRAWLRYGLPIAARIGIALAALSQRAAILIARLWARLPGRVTAPAERLWAKLALPRRAFRAWSAISAARRAVAVRLHKVPG